MVTAGYGKKSQDWSYLTPRRALGVQAGNVVNPTLLGDEFIIDTTVAGVQQTPTERARQQTLVIFAIPKPSTVLAANATLHLWAKVDWDSQCNETVSSSSSASCPDVGSPSQLDAADRWALVAALKHSDAVTGSFASSLCFVVSWLPAGIYKAAIAAGITGSAEVIIAEQHTE